MSDCKLRYVGGWNGHAPTSTFKCETCGYKGDHDTHPGCIRDRVAPTEAAPSHAQTFRWEPSKAELAKWALEAIEAGPNAALLMNLEGIKGHLRRAANQPSPAPTDTQMQKDAERYRWLRSNNRGGCFAAFEMDNDGTPLHFGVLIGGHLDAAIDAAMSNTAGNGGCGAADPGPVGVGLARGGEQE